MLNSAGLQSVQDGAERIVDELTRHGGPWAAPRVWAGEWREVTDPASGMLRKRVRMGDGREMHVEWVATDVDLDRRIASIGLAPTPDGAFLATVAMPTARVQVAGDIISLSGPLAFEPC